jgi:acetolactate synthase-1/2/3 large subunit
VSSRHDGDDAAAVRAVSNDLPARSGALAVIETARERGIGVCFANPGTTEMPLVQALDAVPEVRPVLGLFEGVCTGAADGYARIAGRPASTLLHLGPGLANGIANLHNARRAWSPMVNIVGDHASWHVSYDPPLASDIHSLARPVSGWVHTIGEPSSVAADTAAAIDATNTYPRLPATLIVPLDFQHAQVTSAPPAISAAVARHVVEPGRIEDCARRLRLANRVVFLLGSDALQAGGQRAARDIQALTDASVFCETFPAVAERGGDLPAFDRFPYFPEVAQRVLRDADLVVLAGAPEPISYFGYEGIPAELADPGTTYVLSLPGDDSKQALRDLATALGAPRASAARRGPDVSTPTGELSAAAVGSVVSALLPEGSIVSVEGGTCGYPFYTASATAARHTTMTNTGGAIGQGLPVAVGAAVAAPGRPVIALQSDGSAQYTIQSLWTMAREGLDVVVLIASNGRYGVLQTELDRIDASRHGTASASLTSLGSPAIDWVSLAAGYGVPGSTATTGSELETALSNALRAGGPQLIEMKL